MRYRVRVDEDASSEAFKTIRRDLNRGVRADLRQATERHALPVLKALAPGRLARLARAGATSRSAYLELQSRNGATKALFSGPKGGEVPRLLNWGGTRRDLITARPGSALRTPRGPRSAVSGPRTYKAGLYVERAVETARPAVLSEVSDLLGDRFERAGLSAR